MQHNVFRNVEHESQTGPRSHRPVQMLKRSRFLRVASNYFSFFILFFFFYFYRSLKSKINFQYSWENMKNKKKAHVQTSVVPVNSPKTI